MQYKYKLQYVYWDATSIHASETASQLKYNVP